jgi:hypothetical protein
VLYVTVFTLFSVQCDLESRILYQAVAEGCFRPRFIKEKHDVSGLETLRRNDSYSHCKYLQLSCNLMLCHGEGEIWHL